MAVTTKPASTFIYKNPTSGSLTLESEVSSRFTHVFSDNNKYLVTGLRQKISTYRNSEFEECSIPYCIECQNSTCLKCNELEDYFLNASTGSCDLCGLENCVRCTSLERCMECNETNGYYVENETGLCYPCGKKECLDCVNSTCKRCDETNGYFLNDKSGECEVPCSLENCLKCGN